MTRAEFIEKNKHLFWYINPNKLQNISNEVLVEFIFNYGQWEDVKELVKILGFKELKRVFDETQERNINNYFPEMYNYLKLIVKKYAS
jgi:hypothetical protein